MISHVSAELSPLLLPWHWRLVNNDFNFHVLLDFERVDNVKHALKMPAHVSEDEMSDLPKLDAFSRPTPLMATSTESNLRRSPRKRALTEQPSITKTETASSISLSRPNRFVRPAAKLPAPRRPARHTNATGGVLDGIPLLPRSTTVSETLRTSNNRQSPASPQRSLRLAHVDSLTLPLKHLAMQAAHDESKPPVRREKQVPSKEKGKSKSSAQAVENDRPRIPRHTAACKEKQMPHYTSRFVLKEAHCNDDEEDSNDEDEDEETDLSGFIVDDDVEISFHDTSALESDGNSEEEREPAKRAPPPARRRRLLQRGSPTRRRLEFGPNSEPDSDKENRPLAELSTMLQKVSLENKKATEEEIEVIDLTSSPMVPLVLKLHPSTLPSLQPHDAKPETNISRSNPFEHFDAIMKFSPPSFKPAPTVPPQDSPAKQTIDSDFDNQQLKSSEEDDARFKTPPATPPRSPSKLKSPSKLLSPSKRQTIPRSPHRQSMDAFWDHNVINEWNDEYSPKKAPAASPGKRGLAKFQLWSDSEDEAEDHSIGSSDSLPSPCLSPSKSQSSSKSPEKEEKRRLVEEKRAAATRKKAFDSRKEQLALDLFRELDKKTADGQLAALASSTGGVSIVWSKTLRSTAGRANWRRTITKLSGSPVKGNPNSSDPGIKVQHFASIELAEKIIDCEDRLVNTLAHEFCHLMNFMISNVRNQPHGASFKKWAQKVTSHLRSTNISSWRKVEVTTKHSYVINHKYLWVCTGRPRTPAMEFLNVEEDEGCGGEYGRHSKSIDVEKHRCGKCKGLLVQVRPKPRATASPAKKRPARRDLNRGGSAESSSSSGTQTGALRTLVETIELSD